MMARIRTTTNARFRRLGLSIDEFAELTGADSDLGDDLTLEIARSLARALAALNRLSQNGVDITLGNRCLIVKHLKSAWRENLFLRSRQVDVDETHLTRYGKLPIRFREE